MQSKGSSCRTVSKVPGSSLFLTVAMSTLITVLEILLFPKVGIDWIGIVMLSGAPLVLKKVIDEECPALLIYVQAFANMNEQDVNGNGWNGNCCSIDGYLSSVLFDIFKYRESKYFLILSICDEKL